MMSRSMGVVLALVLVAGTWWVLRPKAGPRPADHSAMAASGQGGCEAPDGDTVSLGAFKGTVSHDKEKDMYSVQLRGARLPFKADPRRASEVPLRAPGDTPKDKNRELLYGIMGPEVKGVTLVADEREKEQVKPAVEDLERYITIVAADKFKGAIYSKLDGEQAHARPEGGKPGRLEDATVNEPVVLLRGPKAGAASTGVEVRPNGQFVIEGKSYNELYAAADMVCLTIVKMLCGSPDCPDASACATGGSCGCG